MALTKYIILVIIPALVVAPPPEMNKAMPATTTPTAGTTTTPTAVTTTPQPRIRTTPGQTHKYYMDSSALCSAFSSSIDYFTDDDNDAYVYAWSSNTSSRAPQTSCSYTLGSYGEEGLEYRFDKLHIGDCGVKVHIYESSTTEGDPKHTYDCHSSKKSHHHHDSDMGLITIQLVNDAESTNFDFTFHVKNHKDDDDHRHRGAKSAIVSLGIICALLFLMLMITWICCCCMRCRNRGQQRERLLPSATVPNHYSYPAGHAPYQQQGYGCATVTSYPPLQGGTYSSPGGAPQPPVYSEKA